MKKYLIILFVMLTASHAFAKKDKIDKDAKIDSLTKANKALTLQLDSISKELVIYQGVYTAVKEKVIKHDFDPSNMSKMIDSVYAQRDSVFSSRNTSATAMVDSLAKLNTGLAALNQENMQLKATINSITADETAKNRLVSELKQLKELLDAKIITPAEFDSKKTKALEKWQ